MTTSLPDDDYFDCPVLNARLKISACNRNREDAKKNPGPGTFRGIALASCKKCKGPASLGVEIIKREVYEQQVIEDLGGLDSLRATKRSESPESYERYRRGDLFGKS